MVKEKPTLRQYGLENTDIDKLTKEYNNYVEIQKSQRSAKEKKVNIGFF